MNKIVAGLKDAVRFAKGEPVTARVSTYRNGTRRLEILPDGPGRFVLVDHESFDRTAPVFETLEKAQAALRAAER